MKPKYFFKILLFFLTITFIITLISFITIQINTIYLEKKIIERYKNSIQILKNNVDTVMVTLNKEIYNQVWTDKYKKFGDLSNPINDYAKGHPFFGIRQKDFERNSLIHSIFFLHLESHQIIEKNKISKIPQFFSYHYPGLILNPKYKPEYFRNIFTAKAMRFRLNISDEKIVVPMIYYYKGNNKNALLINIDESYFHHILNRYKITPNSEIFILDSYRNVFSTTNRNRITKKIPYEIYKNLFFKRKVKYSVPNEYTMKIIKKKYNKPFEIEKNGKKYIVVSCVGKNIWPVYCAVIPKSDIYHNSIPVQYIIFFVTLITLFLSFLLSLFFSRKIYYPIMDILKIFKQENDIQPGKLDELSFIKENINKLISDKNELNSKMDVMLPIITESYLKKIFYEKKEINEDEINKYFIKNKINFIHPNYIVILARLDFSMDFYKKFNNENRNTIINQSYKLLNTAFSTEYNIHILNLEENMFCLILNIKNNIALKEIIIKLRNISSVYRNNNYIDIFYGIGKMNKNIKGLRKSYEEAYSALMSLSIFRKKRIRIFNEKLNNETGYSYSISDENRLFNLLSCGYKKESIKELQKIIDINMNNKISDKNFKELYIQIKNTVTRILHKKGLKIKNIMKEKYISITEKYNKISIEDIKKYIFQLIEHVCENSNISKSRKLNLDYIIDYINKNYTNDISLDIIAYENKISMFYLSKSLKKKLGMHFQEYLNNMRINRAKILLKETNNTINQIASESGYNSRQTFIRMFRKIEGINPSKYRMMSLHLPN